MNPASNVFPVLGNPSNLESANPAPRRLAALLILIVGAALPAWLAGVTAPRPQTRDIHIEAYRYGFSPARIHANRGDRLRLTFSTRDTGQSFFLQDYDLHVSITPGNRLVSVQRLSRPDDPPALTETVELVAGLPGWRGWLVSKSQFRNHTYNGPLARNGAGRFDRRPQFPAVRRPRATGRHSAGGIACWRRRRYRSGLRSPHQPVRDLSLAQAKSRKPRPFNST